MRNASALSAVYTFHLLGILMSVLREDILNRLDIVDLISRYTSLKKVGKNWVGICPFHKEKTPSFTVAEDKQIFKCFGCGK